MRTEARVGNAGEEHAKRALERIGVEMVEKIGTPVRVLGPGKRYGTWTVIFGEKVSGDHHGIIPGAGRMVLGETKSIIDRNLRWSDLREHQPGQLDLCAKLGGLSLLIWVHHSGIYIMKWPVPGFGPGKSINPEMAQSLSIESITGV